jgi:hypothetical protein
LSGNSAKKIVANAVAAVARSTTSSMGGGANSMTGDL